MLRSVDSILMVKHKRLISFLGNKDYQLRFIKFFFLGGMNYLFNIVIIWFETEIIGFYYLFSVANAYLIITVVSFFLHSGYIFKVQRSSAIFFKYIGVLSVFYFAHIGFVMVLTEWLKVYYLLSVIVSITTMFLLKFAVYNNFVFRNT